MRLWYIFTSFSELLLKLLGRTLRRVVGRVTMLFVSSGHFPIERRRLRLHGLHLRVLLYSAGSASVNHMLNLLCGLFLGSNRGHCVDDMLKLPIGYLFGRCCQYLLFLPRRSLLF